MRSEMTGAKCVELDGPHIPLNFPGSPAYRVSHQLSKPTQHRQSQRHTHHGPTEMDVLEPTELGQ